MLLDDLLDSKKDAFSDGNFPVAFSVSDWWESLSEEGWAKTVRGLLLTTPIRAPFPLTWWEWSSANNASGIRTTLGFLCGEESNPSVVAQRMSGNGGAAVRESARRAISSFVALGAHDYLLAHALAQALGKILPFATIVIPRDSTGMALPTDDGFQVGVMPVTLETERDFIADNEMIRDAAWQIMYMQALMHVRNVVQVDHEPDPKLQRARIRRGKPPFVTYKTLHVVAPGVVAKREATGNRGPVQGIIPAHVVRGHFATYTEQKPLLGKYTGTFWRPAHVRGNRDVGSVSKDYKGISPR